MKSTHFYILLLFLPVCFGDGSNNCGNGDKSGESVLSRKLLCGYDKDNRPVKDHNTAVNVTVRVLLKSLLYSSAWAHIEMISMRSWMSLKWKDEYLTWDPEENNKIKSILINSLKIWTPDLSVYNSPNIASTKFNYPCLVDYDGNVTCIPQTSHTGLCSMNYKNWPYDRQTCVIAFGTWMHKGEEVNFFLPQQNAISLKDYRENKYWKLISAAATKTPGVYPNISSTYPTLRYVFVIERHTATITTILVTPAIVMVLMTLVSLFLNISSLERPILMFFNIACHFFYLNNLRTFVPSSGDIIPDAMIFFRDSTILSCLVLFHCIILRNIVVYTSQVPVWVNRVTELMNTRAGKIVFHEFDPQSDSAKIVTEDVENLTKDDSEIAAKKEWSRLALFINRTFIIAVLITYTILILIYLL